MEDLLFGNADVGGNELADKIVKDNYDRRRIVINEDIDDCMLETVCLYILKYNEEDKDIPKDKRKPIWIILNSVGGSVTFGMNIIDCIVHSITPVKCFVLGMAASMASYIPMICKESYCMPNAIICLHDGQTGIVQTSRKANDTMKFYNDCDERLHKIMIENTNITQEFLEEIADREYYIFADKAKELGIISHIIGEDCTLTSVL